jgi:hypothetical protein
MRRLAVSLLAVLLAFAVAQPASAASKRHSCTAKGAKTVVKDRDARVFTTPGGQGEDTIERLYGCLYSNGTRVLLAESSDDQFTSSALFSNVTLNKRFVAWQFRTEDISCKADCPPDYQPVHVNISARDLKAKRTKRFDGAVKGKALAVGRKGTPAWLQDAAAGGAVEVHAGANVLDTGAIDTLKLKGTTLSWLNAGAAKSAPLDP